MSGDFTYRSPMIVRKTAPSRQQTRSEEHTSELQSRLHLVCRLLLEKKKKTDVPAAVGGTYETLHPYLLNALLKSSLFLLRCAVGLHRHQASTSTHDRYRDILSSTAK